MAASCLLWRLARTIAGDNVARLAGALFWATPILYVWLSQKERGFYGSSAVSCLAALLFATRFLRTGRIADALGLGLATGSAIWSSPQAFYLLVPLALCWAVISCERGAGTFCAPRRWRPQPRSSAVRLGFGQMRTPDFNRCTGPPPRSPLRASASASTGESPCPRSVVSSSLMIPSVGSGPERSCCPYVVLVPERPIPPEDVASLWAKERGTPRPDLPDTGS